MLEDGIEQPNEGERDFTAEAMAQGWTDKDEFKGDPDKWIDAKAFVERQDTNLGLLRKKTDYLERELAKQQKAAAKAADFFDKAEKRAYERALAEIRSQQEAAVEAGDVDQFRKLTAEADNLKPKSQYTGQDAAVAMAEWREANVWYNRASTARGTDQEIAAVAYFDRMVEANISKATPGPDQMPPDEFFAMIGQKVLEKYPMLNASPKAAHKRPESDVAAPTGGRSASGSKTYAALPPDAKKACDEMINMGYIKGTIEEARSKYAASYDWN